MELPLLDDIEPGEFKPCVFSTDEMQMTTCLLEDVSYVAVPFYKDGHGAPIHHYIDQLIAHDGRVVGMQVWIGSKIPTQLVAGQMIR